MNFEDILDDLCARFLINLPLEEKSSFERLGFQVEQAYWFYEDFYREENPMLPRLNLKGFCNVLLSRYPPLIAPFGDNFESLFERFLEYKHAIPVCGAIILNDKLDKCLLVKGWSNRAGWGFPQGKIGKGEVPSECAAREVFEETGFDITPRLNPSHYLESSLNNSNIKPTRLYLILNVPESTQFSPQTRKEISSIKWHKIDDLPKSSKSPKITPPNNLTPLNKFFTILPFMGKLRKWIKSQKTLKIAKKERKERKDGEGKTQIKEMEKSSVTLGPTLSKVLKPSNLLMHEHGPLNESSFIALDQKYPATPGPFFSNELTENFLKTLSESLLLIKFDCSSVISSVHQSLDEHLTKRLNLINKTK